MKRISLVIALAFVNLAFSGSIENASCERVTPGIYRLAFEAHGDRNIQVFADGDPDQIHSAQPVATLNASPAEIHIPEPPGRVYFHLKPTEGSARTVSTRRLPLDGASNFRDLGGYRTSDGKYVRWGKVYRSNNLSGLSARDYEFLETIGLKIVCDVRTAYERERQPTHWQGRAPEFLLAPIGTEEMVRASASSFSDPQAAAKLAAIVSPTRGYELFITDYAGEYARAFHSLAGGDVPFMLHCSGGRDRTGTFAALLLTMLRVPRETVVEDYLLSEKYLVTDANVQKMAADMQKSMGLQSPPDLGLIRSRMAMHPEVIESTFRVIDEKFGSFDEYRRNQLHVSDSDLEKIRSLLTGR